MVVIRKRSKTEVALVIARITILLFGLFYAGYVNGLLKEAVSSIHRLFIVVGLIWGIYSGIRALEVQVVRRLGAKKNMDGRR